MTNEDALRRLKDKRDKLFNRLGKVAIVEALDKAILALSAESKTEWIPVSERLPKIDDYYLVTEKDGRVCVYVFRKEGNSEEYWKRCAVAWMSSPEPYKAESEKV